MGISNRTHYTVLLLVSFLLLLGLGVSTVTGSQPAPAAASDSTTELLVQFESADGVEALDHDEYVSQLQAHAAETQRPLERFADRNSGVTIERSFWITNAALVSVDTDRIDPAELARVDGVRAVYQNEEFSRVHTLPDSTEPTSAAQTQSPTTVGDTTHEIRGQESQFTSGLAQISAPAVWDFYGSRGEDVAVAVLDTGVDPSGHEGIARSLERGGWAEFDRQGQQVDSEPHDPVGHGTRVSGIIAGEQTNEGVNYGVAPEVDLYHAKAAGSLSAQIAGIEWAVENDVDVISMSVGPVRYAEAYIDPVENARRAGTAVVASIGNAHRYTSVSPANLQSTLGVGAVDEEGTVPEWSGGEVIETERYWGGNAPADWGDQYTVPAVTAPGVEVTVADPGGEYSTADGASYAAPHAAGALALVLSATDETTAPEAQETLVETARHPAADDPFRIDPGHDARHGAGVVDAMSAASQLRATETISGTVTDSSGDPVAGATVGSEAGPRTTTDAKGRYSLSVPPGRQPLAALDLGYEFDVRNADPAERSEFDFQLSPSSDPAVNLTDGFPTRLGPGEQMTATFDVANVEQARVGLNPTLGATAEELSLRIDGEPVEFGEIVTIDVDRVDTVTVSVAAADDAQPGQLDFQIGFSGSGEQIVTDRVGTVHLHPDPFVVDGGDLQRAVDTAAPGTRLLLEADSYEVASEDGSPGALVVDTPVSIVPGDDGRARITPAGSADSTVYVSANDVTLAGVAVEGSGTEAAVTAGSGFAGRDTDAPSGLTVSESRLVGGTVGFLEQSAPAARLVESELTAGSTGIRLQGPQRTTARQNRIRDVGTGIEIGGLITGVTDNEIRNVEETGIVVSTPPEALGQIGIEGGPISENVIDGATDGIRVEGATASPIENNQLRNIRRTGISVTGRTLGPIRDNSIQGAETGIQIDGTAEGPVEDNEFVDVAQQQTMSAGGSASSSMDLVLYGATAVAVVTLFVPYISRKLRRWRLS
jgi:hypothetical protein